MLNKILATVWFLYVTYYWVTTEGTPWEYVAPATYTILFFVLDVKCDVIDLSDSVRNIRERLR